MIVHSFPFAHEHENIWCNIFIEPVDISGKTFYLVGLSHPGEGIPSIDELHRIAQTAETISPFENAVSLQVLCILIQDAVNQGTWESPFLIAEKLIEIGAPTSAFEEGRSDAARGMHYNANPYAEGTTEFDEWDDGWMVGRDGNVEGLRH